MLRAQGAHCPDSDASADAAPQDGGDSAPLLAAGLAGMLTCSRPRHQSITSHRAGLTPPTAVVRRGSAGSQRPSGPDRQGGVAATAAVLLSASLAAAAGSRCPLGPAVAAESAAAGCGGERHGRRRAARARSIAGQPAAAAAGARHSPHAALLAAVPAAACSVRADAAALPSAARLQLAGAHCYPLCHWLLHVWSLQASSSLRRWSSCLQEVEAAWARRHEWGGPRVRDLLRDMSGCAPAELLSVHQRTAWAAGGCAGASQPTSAGLTRS